MATMSRTPLAAPGDDVFQVSTAFERVRPQGPPGVDSWCNESNGPSAQADDFAEFARSDPHAAERVATALNSIPSVGSEFLGFRLLGELGRGAFARVFLAEQGSLANRPVVLKVMANIEEESRTLAQLQHTNIVPIYSVHCSDSLQAVCMPYFGSTTLATILKDLVGRESLPASGKGLISTLVDRQSTMRILSAAGSSPALDQQPTAAEEDAEATPRSLDSQPETRDAELPAPGNAEGSNTILQMLQGFTHVDAVLWIGARVADGLAHAHEQGILHRDLKPANILLTDYGQPMLLDFNLARDIKRQPSPAAALIGGTLPFMAPEQLDAYRRAECVLNPNSDIYSLGVILYELLTGRHPFPVRRGEVDNVLEMMIEDRRGMLPSVRRWNKTVSPAVESIVQHCLQPDPQKRYQSARELHEDLERQLKHGVLRHAPEPSLRERMCKWVRRHPRLTSASTAAAVAGLLLVGAGASLAFGSYRLSRLEAHASFQRFEEDLKNGRFLLTAQSFDHHQANRGIASCREMLERYGVLSNPSWQNSETVRALSADDQDRLHELAGEALLLLARATSVQGEGKDSPDQQAKRLEASLEFNRLAEKCFADKPCRAILLQRADLTRLLGKTDEARLIAEQAQRIPLRSAWDHYLVAREHALHGRIKEAIPHLRAATEADPKNFWSWFLLGVCRDSLAEDADAAACYSASIALWPEFPWTYFNRGLVYLRKKSFERAKADFDQAVRIKPDLADAYVNRALARQGLEQHREALADLNKALEIGSDHTRVYFMRARVREKLGDQEGAKRDFAEGMRREPNDETGWVARGMARLSTDPKGALADFEKALEINARFMPGLQNKAHLLSRLNRNEEALAALDKLLTLYPDYVPARVGRGVLLARLQKKDAAHRDAQESLLRDGTPATAYQAAGIYALTSQQNPDDRPEAYRLLSFALCRGYGFEHLENDRDLDPIRQQPEFRRLVEGARAIRGVASLTPGK